MSGEIVITGATGQDGLMLTHALTFLGADVIAVARSAEKVTFGELLVPAARWIVGANEVFDDLLSNNLVQNPSCVINLGGNSSVAESWLNPSKSLLGNSLGTAVILEGIYKYSPEANLILASSSEVFAREARPWSSSSNISPSSPYGAAKGFGLELARLYRDVKGLRVSNLILFNHESPLRPEGFLFQSLFQQIMLQADTLSPTVNLHSPEVRKDWSWAPNIVGAIIRHIGNFKARDLVLGSGHLQSIYEIAQGMGTTLGKHSVGLAQIGESRPNDREHGYASIDEENMDLLAGIQVAYGAHLGSMFAESSLLLREIGAARWLEAMSRDIAKWV